MKDFVKITIGKITGKGGKNEGEESSCRINEESMLVTKHKPNLAECQNLDEVMEILSQIAAGANQSLACALSAQLQVIKYVSSPEMIGSTFDLLLESIKKSLESADESERELIKESTGIILSNFIFFFRAKLEWEIIDNRQKIENELVWASNELAGNILKITGYTCNTEFGPEETNKLGKLLFDPKKENDGWYRNFKRQFFRNNHIKEKKEDFIKSIDLLAQKLENKHTLIGANDIIAGIFENYLDQLVESHSSDWSIYEKKARNCRKKSWGMSILTVFIGLLSGLAITFVLFKYGLPYMPRLNHFSKMGGDWLAEIWEWIGVCTIIASALVAISYRIGGRKYLKKVEERRSRWVKYYRDIIELYKEPV